MRASMLMLLLLGAAPPPAAPAPSEDCQMRLDRARDVPRFEDFPAARRVRLPAALDISDRRTRRHRTLIGAQSSQGPNFAGDFTIVAWGCGPACTEYAIVDAASGRAYFPADLGRIATAHVDYHGPEAPLRFNALRFRADSRLLVLVGAPGEDEAREGIAFLEWTGRGLRAIRFIPREELCGH